MIEDRVEVREGDILIIHTGYHHFGWDQPRTRPARSATWSSTQAPTASSPSGARPKRSSGSASTAAAPTTPCLHLCASTSEHHHPQLDAPPGSRRRQALRRDVRHDHGGAARQGPATSTSSCTSRGSPTTSSTPSAWAATSICCKVPRCLRYATGRLRRHHRLFAKRVAFCRRRVVHGPLRGVRRRCRVRGDDCPQGGHAQDALR
jgi:hypothetical protein